MALSDSVRKQIADLVASNRVVLFMKDSRRMSRCEFSAQVVQILDELLPSDETVNVLSSPELRDGIRQFSDGRRFLNSSSADSSLVAAISCAR